MIIPVTHHHQEFDMSQTSRLRLLVIPAVAAMAITAGSATASYAGQDSGWAWNATTAGASAHFISNGDLAQVTDEEKDGYSARGKFKSPSESHTYTNSNGNGWTDTWYPDFPEGEQVKVNACLYGDSTEFDCGSPVYGIA
ncbi:hypothetical protein [Streptomyces sp. R35]|uniref:Secreted protein n=1 Tax=Streptomyces sp. R35 TaxID=3238630 RepID=A0AB39S3K1_9ACTN